MKNALTDNLLPAGPYRAGRPDEASIAPPPLGRAVIYAVALSAYFLIVYNGCNWVASKRLHVGTFYFAWERRIPFVALAIFPYMSIDLFFFFSPLLCRNESELCVHARRVIFTITFAAVAFLLFPLTMGTTRPAVGGLEGMLFTLLEGFDRPYNLVPSLHIALLCIMWVIYSRHTDGALRLAIQVWFIFIAISTLLTNQHHLIDLAGGYLLGVLCFYVYPDELVEHRDSFRRNGGKSVNYRAAGNYAMGAVLLGILAWLLRPWGLFLLWPATASAVVACGYFGLGAGIFRKRDGKLTWSSRHILGPYFLVAWVVRRRFRRACDPYCEVVPRLWVGGKLGPRQARLLLGQGVSAVLDVTAECAEAPEFLNLHYLNLPLLDLTAPTADELRAGVEFIRAHHPHGVYVHCAIGYSRSVCMVLGYLLASEAGQNVDTVYQTVRARRPVALLDARTRRVLEEFVQTTKTATIDRQNKYGQ